MYLLDKCWVAYLHIPKPLLKVTEKKSRKGQEKDRGWMRTYPFAEAVRFCHINNLVLPDTAFTDAYKLVGTQYRDELEQMFLVLKKKPSLPQSAYKPTQF